MAITNPLGFLIFMILLGCIITTCDGSMTEIREDSRRAVEENRRINAEY